MNKSFSYFTRHRKKPLSYHFNTAKRLLSYNWSKYCALKENYISDKELQYSLSIYYDSNDKIAKYFRTRETPKYIINIKKKKEYIEATKFLFPKKIESTINEANQICRHTFDLLGFGPVDLGPKINWHRDFKSGYEWPRVYYKEIYYNDYEKGYDVKIPRELSRYQHLVTLGKAYWYTDDEKYAQEFVDQINDWIKENPPKIGVNWECTMDVAIRAVNWIWGYYFFKDSKSITNEYLIKFLKSILIHGRHIRRNLEWNERVTSNHYISDLTGLVFLGLMFPEFKESKEWLTFGTDELLKELKKQVYDDGMDYEASTSYHRLVLELYYTTVLLLRLNGHEWPAWSWEKIHNMFRFVKGIIKSNGQIPQIGDNDSGRLQILERQDDLSQTYLFPIAAVLLNDPSFKFNDIDLSEEALWLLGPQGYEAYKSMPDNGTLEDLPSCHFKDSGLYIMRSKGSYCVISCGPNGQNGNGGHAHNDQLSFELNIKGKDIIVDPGTYLYTGDYRMRNLFRSTKYHNTIVVDEKEINDFNPQRLFQLKDNSQAQVKLFGKEESQYKFIGEHSGYKRLKHPVHHRRHVIYDENNLYWVIFDSLTGPDGFKHHFDQYFHFASHCYVDKLEEKSTVDYQENFKILFQGLKSLDVNKGWKMYNIQVKGIFLMLSISSNHDISIHLEEGWISKAYGLKEKAPVLKISCLAPCPVYFYTIIKIRN